MPSGTSLAVPGASQPSRSTAGQRPPRPVHRGRAPRPPSGPVRGPTGASQVQYILDRIEELQRNVTSARQKLGTNEPNSALNGWRVGDIIDALSSLTQTASSWSGLFASVVALAADRDTGATGALLSERTELQYIGLGIEALRMLQSAKLLLQRHGSPSEPDGFASQIAEKEVRQLREILALIPQHRLPPALRAAFASVNISATEGAGMPTEFGVPSHPNREVREGPSDMFSNPAERWVIERSSGGSAPTEDADKQTAAADDTGRMVARMAEEMKEGKTVLSTEVPLDLHDDELKLRADDVNEEDEEKHGPPPTFGSNFKVLRSRAVASDAIERLASNVAPPPPITEASVVIGESAGGRTFSTSVQLPVSVLKKQLESADLAKVYGTVSHRAAERNHVDRVVIVKPNVTGRWTYQRLVESKAMQQMISLALNRLRNQLVKLCSSSPRAQRLQILCLVDDSLSMATFQSQVHEAVVLLLEVLRRIECQVAVARFAGSKTNQMLKDFDTALTFDVGELIIERLTSSGRGTCPADALRSIASQCFEQDGKAATNNEDLHRFIVCISDGWTHQSGPQSYRAVCDETKSYLTLLTLFNASRPITVENRRSVLLRTSLAEGAGGHRIDAKDVDVFTRGDAAGAQQDSNLALRVAEALEAMLGKVMSTQATAEAKRPINDPSYVIAAPDTPAADEKKLAVLQHKSLDLDLVQVTRANASATIQRFFCVSKEQVALPGVEKLEQALSASGHAVTVDTDAQTQRLETLQKRQMEVESSLDKIRSDEKYRNATADAANAWAKAELSNQSSIDGLVRVLEESVLPFNKYTRKKGDVRGSNLYIPGLIKAIATDFTDCKKIFANMKAGGKRQYGVAVAVDTSMSMQRFNGLCVLQTLIGRAHV